jgi:hypothetical protein
MRVRGIFVLVAAAVLSVAVRVDAQQSVASARELYASAAYDEALTALNALGMESRSAEEQQVVGLYRVLCLVALGRAAEADAALEKLIANHPLYRPALDDLSPRMRSAFSDTRKRLLPGVVQQRYADAKASFDRRDFQAASTSFKWVLDALTDPDLAPLAGQQPLSDVRTLASGFYDLSEKALEPPPPPPVAVAAPAEPAPALRDYRRLYSPADTEAIPPVVVRQTFPPFPGKVAAPRLGLVEVLIGSTGEVQSATLVVPVHPQYDQLVVSAARRWQYRPAMVDGVPVKYVKQVQVSLAPAR